MSLPAYRLFCMEANGDVVASYWIDAKNDEEALLNARMLRHKPRGEVWHQGSRLVARFNSDGDLQLGS